MQESKLLSTIASSREAFDKLLPYLETHPFTVFGNIVYTIIKKYYDRDSKALSIDWELAVPFLEKELPKKEAFIREFVTSLPTPASVPNVLQVYESAKKERLTLELMQALSSSNEPRIKELIEQYQTFKIDEQQDELYNKTTIENLDEHFTGTNLIPIYPKHLSDLLGGGVPRQSNICIFGRPDVGKSVTSINIAAGCATNNFKVLYIGNEDPPAKMMYRMLTRFCRQPESVLKQDPKKWNAEALKNGYGNLYFVPMHPGTIKEIRKRVEQIKPDVVIIDQIRNLNLVKDAMTLNLEMACKYARNLAKEFNLVMIVVTQAGESAHNKLFLDYTDVEWSNTGVAGAMDLMVGVGQNRELRERNHCVLSFPKNKLTNTLKPITCTIDYERNRLLT